MNKYHKNPTPMDYNGYKGQVYTADFETSTDKWGVDKARVWLWDICQSKSYKHTTGTDLKEFFKALYNLSIHGYKSVIVAFHNLAYDGAYVLTWLLENGYTPTQSTTPMHNQFYTLITTYGQHYQYIINMGRGLSYQSNFYVVIVDSYKTIHKSVHDIAQAYELPILKGEIDYDMYREIGYVPTGEEVDYIHNDTEIMARALDIQIRQGFTKVTQPANALHHYKKLIGKKNFETLFPPMTIILNLYENPISGECAMLIQST